MMAGKKEIKLVPTEEQPYEIPENWCWVRMRDLYVINPKNSASDDLPASFVPMERIAPGMVSDFTYEVQPWGKAKKGHTQFADGDVAFAKISPCFENRKSMMVNGLENGIGAGTTELIILRQPLVDQAYTFWLVSDDRFIQGGNQTYSGTVGQQRISMDYVRDYPVPLAPLAEQKRIVDTIVDLFADLDKAAENAQRIVDTYEQRRAAILADAFAGNLTEQWRNENGYSLSTWRTCRFDEVAAIKSNLVDPADYQEYPHIAPDNIEKRSGVLLNYRTIAEDKVTSGKHRFYPGQILYSKIRPYLSKVTMVDFDGLCSADMYPIEAMENTRYLLYFMLSDEFLEQASSAGSRSVLPKINQKELSALEVRMPDTEAEQQEIVRILDELLGNEQRIKEAAEEMLDKLAMMKKSILADAFRGKLGTNDSADEPATELLRQILA